MQSPPTTFLPQLCVMILALNAISVSSGPHAARDGARGRLQEQFDGDNKPWAAKEISIDDTNTEFSTSSLDVVYDGVLGPDPESRDFVGGPPFSGHLQTPGVFLSAPEFENTHIICSMMSV